VCPDGSVRRCSIDAGIRCVCFESETALRDLVHHLRPREGALNNRYSEPRLHARFGRGTMRARSRMHRDSRPSAIARQRAGAAQRTDGMLPFDRALGVSREAVCCCSLCVAAAVMRLSGSRCSAIPPTLRTFSADCGCSTPLPCASRPSASVISFLRIRCGLRPHPRSTTAQTAVPRVPRRRPAARILDAVLELLGIDAIPVLICRDDCSLRFAVERPRCRPRPKRAGVLLKKCGAMAGCVSKTIAKVQPVRKPRVWLIKSLDNIAKRPSEHGAHLEWMLIEQQLRKLRRIPLFARIVMPDSALTMLDSPMRTSDTATMEIPHHSWVATFRLNNTSQSEKHQAERRCASCNRRRHRSRPQ
jgi:hypothetical protein